MPHGSGIATYGHTLLETLKNAGAHGQVLYGPADGIQPQDTLTEATIIAGHAKPRKANLRRAAVTLTSRFGIKAFPLHASTAVHWPRAGMRQPVAQSYWVARELFHLGQRAFDQYDVVVPVQFSEKDGISSPDVMHWTCPLPLKAKGVPNILTIHDIIPLTLPHSTNGRKVRYHRMVQSACRNADHIFCVTETSRNDLTHFFDIPDNKISVTYQPVLTPDPYDQEQDQAWLYDTLKLKSDGYFLFYGAIEPKKNLGRIIEAYLESRSQTPLVIIAGRQWLEEYETSLLDAFLAANPQGRILKLDFLPRSSLDRLIRGAKATLFPSLYEGFGLPILEAMAQGSPVITSNFGAMAEVAGGAAAAVDPYNSMSIAQTLRMIDNDSAYRKELALNGITRAADFSPESYLLKLKSAYSKIGINI